MEDVYTADHIAGAPKTLERMPITILAEGDVDPAFVADTDKGKVAGYLHEKGVVRFSSIPFGAPPVGPLRYSSLQPREAWSGILDT